MDTKTEIKQLNTTDKLECAPNEYKTTDNTYQQVKQQPADNTERSIESYSTDIRRTKEKFGQYTHLMK